MQMWYKNIKMMLVVEMYSIYISASLNILLSLHLLSHSLPYTIIYYSLLLQSYYAVLYIISFPTVASALPVSSQGYLSTKSVWKFIFYVYMCLYAYDFVPVI